jgi:hypothetical protein
LGYSKLCGVHKRPDPPCSDGPGLDTRTAAGRHECPNEFLSKTRRLAADDDYDVLSDGVVVGPIMKANAAPVGSPWLWTLAFGYREDRTPMHGYAPPREAAMAGFAKSWRRE